MADADRTPSGAPALLERPPAFDMALLGVAVVAVSTSAPLIRAADAPALAVAFWRTILAVPVLALVLAAGGRRGLADLRRADRKVRRGSALAGVLLGLHFAAWVPSLSFTSVASSTALVATQPAWAALIARWRGDDPPRAAWIGIAVAMAGAAALTGVDLSISPRALFGDLLALVGGMLAAAYVTVGGEVRRTASTAVYSLLCYLVASGVLLAICVGASQPLSGYDSATWAALLALTAGPQLLGHTMVNRVLRTTSATLVSVAILFEIVGAALLAWIFFDEVPPLSAVPAVVLLVVGLILVARATPDTTEPPVE
jgi:drug/metabolite transporter (DMT)-like permease